MSKNLTVEELKNILVVVDELSYEEFEGVVRHLNVLTKGRIEEIERFVALYHLQANRNLALAIQQYKQLLRKEGRGSVNVLSLKKAYQKKDFHLLQRLLCELGLSYISGRQVTKLIQRMVDKGLTIEDVYNKHRERPNRNIVNLLG